MQMSISWLIQLFIANDKKIKNNLSLQGEFSGRIVFVSFSFLQGNLIKNKTGGSLSNQDCVILKVKPK